MGEVKYEVLTRFPKRQEYVLYILHEIQKASGTNSISEEALKMVSEYLGIPPSVLMGIVTYYSMYSVKPRGKYVIRVCRTLACQLMGSQNLVEELKKILGIGVGETTSDGLFTLELTDCLGCCGIAPAIMVNETLYGKVTPEFLRKLIESLRKGQFLTSDVDLEFLESGNEVLLKGIKEKGAVLDIEDAEKLGVYSALKKIANEKISPEVVIEMVKASGLRGRGGAGFPTGKKWELVRKEKAEEKYILCNADEGEPGTFKDRIIQERDPHKLIEGMIIAGYATGAKKGYIYIRGEYTKAIDTTKKAIEQARRKGYLGKNILGLGFDFDIEVFVGAGSYVCGEETTLIESLEGKRGHPRFKPPYPVTEGLWGKPTVVNNVETLINIPDIILNGPEWYKSLGTQNTPGTKIFTISGKVEKPGFVELPLGVTVRDIIYKYAGGVRGGKKLKGVLIGGASGAFLTPEELDIAVDFDNLRKHGAVLGSGAIVVFDEDDSIPEVLMNVLHFFRHESCGKCVPCRIGTQMLVTLMDKVMKGEADENTLVKIEKIAKNIGVGAFCPFGQSIYLPVHTALQKFSSEFKKLVKV